MKYLLTIVVLVFLLVHSEARKLSTDIALQKAAEFLNSSMNESAARSKNFIQKDLKVVRASDNAVMVAEEGGGNFVLICGDDNEAFVAGYGTGTSDKMPPSLSLMMTDITPSTMLSNNVKWAQEDGYVLPIAPLVQSKRHQSAPFNLLCPYYIYDDGAISLERCLVGCVATATEQVVSHYAYPQMLLDSISGFETVNNGVLPTIPAGTTLDFKNILNNYDAGYTESQALAVAELSYYIGIACHMDWGVGSSGANLSRLVEPLRRAFGYKYARCISACDYSPRRWFGLLMNELTSHRPVVYAGYVSTGGGHAFVLDGINTQGYFHISWGYGGNYDGYFDLSVFTPQENPLEPTKEGSICGLSHMQEALFLHPDSVEYVTDDTLEVVHRIDIDTVIFNRAPDTNMYMEAEVKIRNVSDQDVYSPIELFTYTSTDSTGYPEDIDYLGMVDAVVKAHTDTTLVSYIHCSVAGRRYLGLNAVDSMYLPFDTLNISKASQPQLAITLENSDVDSENATFLVKIKNKSKLYWSGRRITYSIFEGDYTEDEGDWRHFTMLNLPPLAELDDEVTFGHLLPQTQYTFVVRNPWQPALQYHFITPEPTAVQSIASPAMSHAQKNTPYRLNHKILIDYDKSTGRYRQILQQQR